MASSFRRAVPNPHGPRPAPAGPRLNPKLPHGSRLSSHNGQVLVSSGVGSLDDLLGGGLPLGTVLLVDEDHGTGYATLLLQYFLAQGLQLQHGLCVISADEPPAKLVEASPGPLDPKRPAPAESTGGERMTIAWWYQNLPQVGQGPPGSSVKSNDYCSEFDLSKSWNPEQVRANAARHHYIDLRESDDPCRSLYDQIATILRTQHYFADTPVPPNEQRNALRLAIHAIGSPFWKCSVEQQHRFFHQLKSLLRRSFAVAMITVSEFSPISRPAAYAQADFAISLDAFATSRTLPDSIRKNPHLTADATGLVQVHRVARLNALVPSSVKLSVLGLGLSQSLSFQVRRKRFSIETWHLPPEFNDPEPAPAASKVAKGRGTGKKHAPPGAPCSQLVDF